MTYDAQFDRLRQDLDRTRAQADLSERSRELDQFSYLLKDVTQKTIAQTEQIEVLAGITHACNNAWGRLEAVRSEPMRLTPVPPQPARIREGGDPEFDATIEEGLQRLRRPEKRRA